MKLEICDSPIFVVGAPRSGTSMMQWALRQHPHLWGGQESDFLVPLIAGLRDSYEFGRKRDNLHWLSGQDVAWPEFLEHVGYGLNALFTRRADGRRWVEQTPLYTLHLDDVTLMFPTAQFIMMLRDGRDVVHSLRHFAVPQSHEQACETWVRYTEAALRFAQSQPVSSVLITRYDEVVKDAEEGMRRIYSFLDEPYQPASAAFIVEKRINSSFPNGEDSAIEGWTSWTARERATFQQIAGRLLERTGFDPAM